LALICHLDFVIWFLTFGLDLSFELWHLDFADRVSAFSIIEEIPSTKRQISNNIGARNI